MLFRCPECRTRRKDYGLFPQHLKTSGHKMCRCGGYHYSHRKGSTYCYENPISAIFHAARQGADESDLLRIAASIAEEAPHLVGKLNNTCKFLNLKEIS